MTKPNAAEVLRIAREPDLDLEFEHVLNMTHEEVRQSLMARGHDLRVLEAEADILWNMYRPKRSRTGFIAGGLACMSSVGVALAMAAGSATTVAAPVVFATMTPAPQTAPAEQPDAADVDADEMGRKP